MSIRQSVPGALLLFVAVAALMQSGCGSGPGQAASPRAISSTLVTKRTFGLDIHDAINHWPTEPFGFWRLWDATVDWARVEPARGVFDFTRLDQYVKLAEQHHVQLIYVMGNTPAWSAQDPNAKSNEGVPGASSPPTDVQDWQDFVTTVATRYKGRIQAYEIWNEANLAGYWTGSLDGMLQMAQIAYTTIKHVDPVAAVLAPSVVAQSGLDWLSKFLAAGGANYTDAIAYHLYSTNKSPESVLQYYQDVMSLGQQWGKAVWNTEVGWGPWGTFDETQSASFLARMLILQSAAGLTHIGWYAWDDRGAWVHLYLVEADMHTPTLAGIAFGQVQSWLDGSAVACSNELGTWQCELTAAGGKKKYILWNPNSTLAFAVPSAWQVNSVRDLGGAVHGISGAQTQVDSMPVLLEP